MIRPNQAIKLRARKETTVRERERGGGREGGRDTERERRGGEREGERQRQREEGEMNFIRLFLGSRWE